MYRCHECYQTTPSVTLGWNERQNRAQWVCAGCFRELGTALKSAECRLLPGDPKAERSCIVAKGHAHIHTSGGPLYPDSKGIRQPDLIAV